MPYTVHHNLQCDGYEERKIVEIFSAIYESSETGQPVTVG